MTVTRLGRKFLKIIGIFLGSLALLLIGFHFWVVHNAEKILEDLVDSKSNHKLKLEVRNFKFNWFSRKMELEDAVFYTTDSTSHSTTYRFAVKKIKLKVKSVFPIIFEKKVLITDLDLKAPDITVTRLRASRDTTRGARVSIPLEMGRIYNSIQDALQVLRVKKFEIEDAKFTLVNKMAPDEAPISIGHIDFHIDNLLVNEGKLTGKEKIFFSDNIVFKSRDQDILFPDKRHRLSYRKFRINIEKKIVEFDSCTLAAIKVDSTDAAFSIFFDALQMTNIDFDTLYRAEVIKADSVYCTNPQFNLNVTLGKKTGPKKAAPKLDEIIRQLTGDLLLNFVVVNNAGFNINTTRNGIPNSFSSSGNNFEMQGLRIDNDAKQPLKVAKFAMAIRNYENFLRDSTFEMRFDSVLFNDDRILLSDFSFKQIYRGRVVKDFEVPQFQLSGLSWDDLLFEQKLTAQWATLYDPKIRYIEVEKKTEQKKNRSLFDALGDINNVIMLEDLNIIRGDIDMHLAGNVQMQLTDANLSVESRALLGSNQVSDIRRSVNRLDFTKGLFKINDFTIQLDNINYTGVASRLKAANVTVFNQSNSIAAQAGDVSMNEIFINEKSGDISIGEINWQKADINLSNLRTNPARKKGSFITLTDIRGANTKLSSSAGNKKMSAFVNNLSASAFLLKPGEKPIIADLDINGKDLSIADSVSQLNIPAFALTDNKDASFKNIRYLKRSGNDTMDVNVPQLTFIPHIQTVINGDNQADEMRITKPVLYIHSRATGHAEKKSFRFPKLKTNKIVIDQPEINFFSESDKGKMSLKWKGGKSEVNSLALSGVQADDSVLSAQQLSLSLDNFVFENPKGKRFDAGKGEVAVTLNNISFRNPADSRIEWRAAVSDLKGKNFVLDSLGKKKGKMAINTMQLQDLVIHSSSISHIRKVIEENPSFRVQQITGNYTDSAIRMDWYNGGYDKNKQSFSLDSFAFYPTMNKDSFVATHPYQSDFIKVTTGAIQAGPFDIDKYLKDTILAIGHVNISDVKFNDFRDNRPPFQAGIIKPLMVDRIKSIPVKISIDTVQLDNANVVYAELNPKTNQTGTIPVTRMTLLIFPVHNFGYTPTDSLRIHANGYLMDSVWIRLRLKESYTDSLSGFLMTVRMKQADMRILNPVIGPLASAKLKSGWLDTMSMRVGGNEYLAYGEMKMSYHDLKIELLRNGGIKRPGLFTFLINTIVKNKNTNRTGNVFFIRNRERSAINYLIKIVMSGAGSSVGAKNNRKIMRKYKRELRERHLPPVEYD